MAGNGSRGGSSRSSGGTTSAAPKAVKGPQKVDFNGAMRIAADQVRAEGRLRANQYSFNGNGAWAQSRDRYYAKSTTEGLAREAVRGRLSEYRRIQAQSRFPNYNQAATPESAARYRSALPGKRAEVMRAVRTARAFRPRYLGELQQRYEARQRQNASRRSRR
jgi:hypothetical protein